MVLSSENNVYIASVVGTYWVVSISMVYLNKVLMSNEGVSINAPLFVTWFQCIVTAFICWGAGKCGQRQAYSNALSNSTNDDDEESNKDENQGRKLINNNAQAPKPSFFSQFPAAEYTWEVGRRIFPLSVIFVCMITFNNLCLKWVEVSFYNVARSFTIVFNVFFSFVLLKMTSSCKTVACLGVVIIGFLIGSVGEINFSMRGTVAGLLSSLFVSLNSIFTKKLLPVVDDNHWRLTFYNNVNASLLFIPLMIYFEKDVIITAIDDQLVSATFWSAMCVAGFFGFSIGIVTVLQIKATSPLSHNISGTAKAAVQSMMAFYIWGNEATVLGVLGIFTVLGGSLLYTYVKMEEGRKAQMMAAQQQQQAVEMKEQQQSLTAK